MEKKIYIKPPVDRCVYWSSVRNLDMENTAFIKVSIGSLYAISLWEKECIKIAFVVSDRNIKSAYVTL